MAGLASAAAIVCLTLPETLNKPTMEDLTQDKKKTMDDDMGEQNDNKVIGADKKEDTLM